MLTVSRCKHWLAAALVLALLAGCGGTPQPTAIPATAVPPTEIPPAELPAAEEPTTEESATEASATEVPAADTPATVAPAIEASAEIINVPAIATPSTVAAEGVLLIDATLDRGAISPLVYGANTGPLWVLLPAVWEEAAALNLGVIHYPGGEWGDQVNLTEKQVDDMVALSERLGAQTFISVRLPDGTAEFAASLVEYANVQQAYGIELWAIGNEPNLYAPRHGEEWTPQHYADQWRLWAQAMKAVDPAIRLMGPEVTGFVGEGDDLSAYQRGLAEWVRVFLETNGDLVDIVSIHRYPFPHTGGTQAQSATVEELLTQPREMDGRVLPDLRRMIHEITGRDIPIAITEYGLDSRNIIRGETAPNSTLSAIWWGDSLARSIHQGVEIVTYWNLTARDAQGGHGIFTQFAGRPVYYTFDLYSRFGENLVSADAGNPDVFALAALRADGALTVMLSNTSQQEQRLMVDLQGFAGETSAAWRVVGDREGMSEIAEALVHGEELLLPPASLTLFVLE